MSARRKTAIDWKAVGRRLRELRGYEIKQEDFARRIGVAQGTLSKYEKGRVELGADVLLQIAQEFSVSIEWILTGRVIEKHD